MQIDDETLMALADGELDPDLAARLSAAIASDPEAQARLNRFVETRARLRVLAEQGQDAGKDAALIARIRAAAVVPGQSTQMTPPPSAMPPVPANRRRAPLAAIAAALAALAVGIGWWNGDGSGPDGLSAAEIAALGALPSGEGLRLEDGRNLTMIASYRVASDTLCREYETASDAESRVVIACRENGGWQVRLAGDVAAGDGYRPASGGIAAVEDWLADSGAGEPLTPEAEAAALTD